MFLDESGEANVTKPDPRFNIFSLCGVVFTEPSYYELDHKMNDLKIKFWESKDIIFHSYTMRKQEKAFKIFQTPGVLQNFYSEIEKILTECDYKIISCVVLKDLYRETYPDKNFAYETALQFICERAAFLINRIDCTSIHICIEKRERSKNRLLFKHYNDLLQKGNHLNGAKIFEKFDRELHFRDKKKNINGLQLADICAYPIAFKSLYPNRTQKTYELILEKIHSWNGNIHGVGLKVFPKHKGVK